jgi:CheY-like chemotaxis protein
MKALILVVDDEKPIREFLAQALTDQGHRVVQAFNGRQALSLAVEGAERPDVVISDVMMPLGGGVELCRALKSNPRTASIPVMLMSAAAARTVEGSGADAFIRKPFDLDALDSLLDTLFAGLRPTSEDRSAEAAS